MLIWLSWKREIDEEIIKGLVNDVNLNPKSSLQKHLWDVLKRLRFDGVGHK